MAGLDHVAHGGTYLLVSVVLDLISFPGPRVPQTRDFAASAAAMRRLRILPRVFDAMRGGLIPTGALVTHRVPLEDAPGGFPSLDQTRDRGDQGPDRDLGVTEFPILQFGASRFLQAHVDLFVSEALPRGEAMGRIAVAGTTGSTESRRRVAAFATGHLTRFSSRASATARSSTRSWRFQERRRRRRRPDPMGRARAPVHRGALRHLEHRRPRLRDRPRRPAGRRAATVVPGQARQAPARAP